MQMFYDELFQVNMRLKWVLENNEMVRHLANEGHVMFGTIDTWLIYRMTEGKVRCGVCETKLLSPFQ